MIGDLLLIGEGLLRKGGGLSCWKMKWFRLEEFKCRCCGQLPPVVRENVEALVEQVLDPVRERLERPIFVNSGYRCQKHNAEVGGVPGSQHVKGEAADIRVEAPEQVGGDVVKRLGKVIEELGKYDQLIYYRSFIHVSWRRNGVNRRQVIHKG